MPKTSFIQELDRRSKSFLDGSAKTYSLQETKAAARKKVKKKNLSILKYIKK